MKSINWKAGLIAAIVLAAVFIGMTAYVKSQKEFKVTHFDAVEQTVDADGGYVAGSPEVYKLDISGALAWKMTGEKTKVYKVLAWVIIGLVVLFVLIVASDLIDFGTNNTAVNKILL